MPKSRTKNSSSKNASATAPVPLLDSIRAQIQSSSKPKNDKESDIDNSKVSTSGWQCDVDDWSEKNASNSKPNVFPPTISSMERKTEQAKNNFFLPTKGIHNENENKSEIQQQMDDATKRTSFDNVDISQLTSIVTDLITGKRDQSAYKDFLSILQHFSVYSSRDDHLEETVYHLIQAAVSFIRSNEHRFDPTKLQECYRQRYILKTNSTQ